MIGITKYKILILAATLAVFLFCLPTAGLARAGMTLQLGFSMDGGIITSEEQTVQLATYLSEHLGMSVKAHLFADSQNMRTWLVSQEKLHLAWFNKQLLAGLPTDQVLPLVELLAPSGETLDGQLVSRQGVDAMLLQDIRSVMLSMHKQAEGKAILSQMGGERFIPALEPPSGRNKVSSPITLVDMAEPKSRTQVSLPGMTEKTSSVGFASIEGNGTHQSRAEKEDEEDLPEGRDKDSAEQTILNSVEPSALSHPPDKQAITLQADNLVYQQNEETYEASGSVMLGQGNQLLTAEELIWQTTTQDVAARVDVNLQDPDGDLQGQRLHYNLATGRGELKEGQVFIRDRNFHLAGSEIEKLGEGTFRVADGEFTTCDGDTPDWKFSAEQVDVALGDYAYAKNALFHIKNIPVLYTPYLIFPVKVERSSGMLMPRYGYSDDRGTQISAGWYQVIDRNMDATIYLDYYSELGYGKGIEYRYLLGNDNRGDLTFYHVSGIMDFPDMYAYDWQHGGTLPGKVWLSADVQYVDDVRFFDEFGETAEEYNKDKTVSNVWLQRNWEKINLVGRGRYIKDLEQDNFDTVQRLPELSLNFNRTRLGKTPFYASFESLATNFTRKEGEEGRRLYLKPSLAAALKPGSWLEFVPQVALNERLYDADSPDDESAVPEFSATLGTRLQKVFFLDNFWGWDRLMHSIEPNVTYSYIPEEVQDDLPLFDVKDRIPETNLIEYALVNRLIARTTNQDGRSTYREFMNLRLSQRYNVLEARDDEIEDKKPFSNLRVQLNLKPTTKTYVNLDNRIKVHDDLEFTRFAAGVGWSGERGNQVSASYTYRDNLLASNLSSEYLTVSFKTSILDPLHLSFSDRYDLTSNTELEKVIDLEYRSQCWSIFFTFRDKLDEEEFFVTFALAGIGRIFGFGGGLGTDPSEEGL